MPYRYTTYFACLVLAGVGICWAHVEGPKNGNLYHPRLVNQYGEDISPEWPRSDDASLTRNGWNGLSDFFRMSKRKVPSMRVMKRNTPSWRQTNNQDKGPWKSSHGKNSRNTEDNHTK